VYNSYNSSSPNRNNNSPPTTHRNNPLHTCEKWDTRSHSWSGGGRADRNTTGRGLGRDRDRRGCMKLNRFTRLPHTTMWSLSCGVDKGVVGVVCTTHVVEEERGAMI
jgi:hypothetical protein